jgi:hypothetical protein
MTMDTNNQIPEYLKTLPQKVQDFVLNGVWEERSLEIAKKYSLNAEQADMLADEVLYILIGLELPERLQDSLVAELSISKLLATQIENDLETRVFQYALNAIEANKESKPEKIPEIRPGNLPMVEEGEKVQVREPVKIKVMEAPQAKTAEPEKVLEVKPLPTIEKPTSTAPKYIPPYKPIVENKPAGTVTASTSATPVNLTASMDPLQAREIQRPVSVPRFTAVAMDEKGDVIPASPEKMGVPEAVPAAATPSTAAVASPAQKPPEKYEVDPYLEPI